MQFKLEKAGQDAVAERGTAVARQLPHLPDDPIDELIWSSFARLTRGASPLAFATAWFDFLAHMSVSPGRRRRLATEAGTRMAEAWMRTVSELATPQQADATSQATRFERALSSFSQAYDGWTDWLTEACQTPNGVSRANARRVAFSVRQMMEAAHPRNLYWMNGDALRATREEQGRNLLRGWSHLLEDLAKSEIFETRRKTAPPELGRRLAVTPGRVVYRNRLIELIQYEPATSQVASEPVLFVPAWIMKYYILDLTPGHSLIEYLVSQGFTVFAISWRNPDADDRDLGFDDYRTLGVLAALDAIEALVPETPVHTVGYCLGGTLLSVAAAGLARDGDHRIASLTLLAAQTDFSEAGELTLFIDEAQLTALEAGMASRGYLDGTQMAGAFSVLRSRELLWRRMQEAYFLGQRGELIDLMIWNGDHTRMPSRMHSEYLRRFFLHNDFVNGRILVDDRPAAISDIRAPIFALGTTKDHVAPWRSVFKIHLFADTDVTFALTNGGHNAGIVSPPGHPRRRHHIFTKADEEHFIDPDAWLERAEERNGSWWPSWSEWLKQRSSGTAPARVPAFAKLDTNRLANAEALPVAPGTFVFE